MRRILHKKTPTSFKAIVYVILGLVMAIYAIPRLPAVSFSISGLFTVVWLLFALLFVASNLYYLFGVDREVRRTAESIADNKAEHHRKVLMDE